MNASVKVRLRRMTCDRVFDFLTFNSVGFIFLSVTFYKSVTMGKSLFSAVNRTDEHRTGEEVHIIPTRCLSRFCLIMNVLSRCGRPVPAQFPFVSDASTRCDIEER